MAKSNDKKRTRDQILRGMRNTGIGISGVGAGVFTLNTLTDRGALDKKVVRYDPSKGQPIRVVYTNPKHGAGHFSQAKAIVRELERQKIPAELVPIERYMDPKLVEATNTPYRKMMDVSTPKELEQAWGIFKDKYDAAWKSFDQKRFMAEMNNSSAVITTNPWIKSKFKGLKKPVNVLYSDPAVRVFERLGDETPKQGLLDVIKRKKNPSFSIYLTDNVRRIGRKEGVPEHNMRRIANVPVNMGAFQGAAEAVPKGKVGHLNPQNFNVLITGGGLGLDVDRATKDLLRSKTTTVGGKPVVFHVITGGTWGSTEAGKARLAAVESYSKAHPGRVVVHKERVPLPTMMRNADFLVVQPHGTSGTEAIMSKTPSLTFVQDPVQNGKVVEKKYSGLLSNNAIYFNEKGGVPIASTGYQHLDQGAGAAAQNKMSNIADVFDTSVQNREKIQKSVASLANSFEDTPKAIIDDLKKNRTTVQRNAFKGLLGRQGAKGFALTGATLSIGAAVTHKYLRKEKTPKGKTRYIYAKKLTKTAKKDRTGTYAGVGVGSTMVGAGLYGKKDRFVGHKASPQMTTDALLTKAKRGDILVTGRNVSFKTVKDGIKEVERVGIGAFGGAPKNYHTVVVTKNTGKTVEVLSFGPDVGVHKYSYTIGQKPDHGIVMLRRKDKDISHVRVMEKAEDSINKFEKMLRSSGLPEQKVKMFRKSMYSGSPLVRTGFKEVFLPYTKGKSRIGEIQKFEAGLDAFIADMPQQAKLFAAQARAGKKPKAPRCFQGICTGYVAESGGLKGGPKKLEHVSPSDFLRSKELNTIGSAGPKYKLPAKTFMKSLRGGPLLLLGAGAGLAGVATKKLVDYAKKK